MQFKTSASVREERCNVTRSSIKEGDNYEEVADKIKEDLDDESSAISAIV